jgi:hypothetical protein
MMTVAAANNVRNANTRGMRLYKVFILWKLATWKLHNFLQNLHRLWT